jgi:4-amino-4-deoxy-L-arabinose transferase-like glycosyltransferase
MRPSRWSRLSRLTRLSRWPRRVPRSLTLLLLVGALQTVAWNIATPAFQGPDEDLHFAYVQHLAETGEVPSASAGAPHSTEQQEVMLALNLVSLRGNLSARPAWGQADVELLHQVEDALPAGSRGNGTGSNPQAKNPPLYYAIMAIPYRLLVWLPLLKRLFMLRLFNAIFYLTSIVLTWLIAGELFGRVRWQQTLAAGAVALQPEMASMSAVINADNLLITLTTGVLLAALRVVRRGPSLRRILTASVLVAAAMLTQGRGLVTLPVLAVALVVAWIRHRPPVRETLVGAAGAVGTVGVALGAYFAFGRANGSGSLYGGQLTELNSGTSFSLRQFLSSIYQFYFPKLATLQPRIGPAYGYRQVFINTFYGTFDSLEVTFNNNILDALQVLSALGLLGLYTACVSKWRRLWRAWGEVLVMLGLLATTIVFLHYVSYRSLLGDGGIDPLITGRYLLPIISLFGLAISFTVGSLPRRVGPPVAAVILVAGVLLSLAGIGITMTRFYA